MDKKKVEIGIAIVIILALIVLLFFIFRGERAPDAPVDEQPTDQVEDQVIVPSPVDSRTVESPPDIIARSFVERFGSYSTEVDFQNVDDVKPLSTAGLQNRLDDIAETARSATESAYYGVSTKVISIDTVTFGDTAATIEMNTQRKESFDSPANTSIRYQGIVVELEKAGSRWLVNNFTWVE